MFPEVVFVSWGYIVLAKIFIHPGAHKTATTAVQSVLNRSYNEGVRIVTPKDYRFSQFDRVWRGLDSGDLLKLFKEEFVSADVCWVSEERLLGEPLMAGDFYPKRIELARLIECLVEEGHEVKVLLTVRNMFDFLRSWYLQVVFSGASSLSFIEYLESRKATTPQWAEICSSISQVCTLKVVAYESLLVSPEKFADDLNDFFESNVFSSDSFDKIENPSIDSEAYAVMLSAKGLPKRTKAKLGTMVKKGFKHGEPPVVCGEFIEDVLRKYFSSDNVLFFEEYLNDLTISDYWS
ncbi:hypothetical protein [Salinicola rhizosphaerae]|uniref:Sulfotransferase family protein n=1 Tax=Salinicola rhizosphaerae TaxID=1443141 RepID=A0ABQ3DPK8_9GAMM|nr:hypothetical protein [Salinicola rhizosphaerae]GHB06984.1 hypothetical protein GCM10009038_00190 [Salinicola rhizosphaerae]